MGRTFKVIGSSHPRGVLRTKSNCLMKLSLLNLKVPLNLAVKRFIISTVYGYGWLIKNRACYSKCGQRSAGLASFGSML